MVHEAGYDAGLQVPHFRRAITALPRVIHSVIRRTMFRLAHISDVHLGPLPKVSLAELASKRITGYVNWQRNRRKNLFGGTLDAVVAQVQAERPDHVAITGDMVNLATDLEIEAVEAWLESSFQPSATTLVPGNHDAYVPGALARAKKAWKPFFLSGGPDRSEPLFPTLTVRGTVALIGVSTSNATLPFMATGDFSRSQERALGKLLEETGRKGLCRVILIHHPPVRGAADWHKRMIGIGRFARLIARHGAELILHGHTHLDTLYHLPGRDGPVPVVGIASASQGPGGHKPPAGYNLFEIDGGPGAWTIAHRRMHLTGTDGTFAVNPVATLPGPDALRQDRAVSRKDL